MDETETVKAGKYCPVCEKVYREGLDFCPVTGHEKVLLIRVRDWGEGFKIFITKDYDEADDDFRMDEGLDRDIIAGAGGLTKTQLVKLRANTVRERVKEKQKSKFSFSIAVVKPKPIMKPYSICVKETA